MAYDYRSRSYYVTGSFDDFTTTQNTYDDVGTWEIGHYGTKRLRFSSATNDLNVQILGSFDGGTTYPITVVSEFLVATATPVVQTITDLLTHLKVQVDPAVDDSHGVLSTEYVGWSR